MIRHTILFKVKPEVSQQAIDSAFLNLFALQNKLHGIHKIAGGKCNFHRGVVDATITHGFSIDFENDDACNEFLQNPITQPAKDGIVNIAVNEHEGLYGFDIGKDIHHYPSPLDKRRVPRLQLLPPGSLRRDF